MKVQLASEDAEQRLYEASMLIASRLGSITSDIARLRGNLAGMADSVDNLSVQTSADERQCSGAASRLQKLHTVKTRMLAAKKTLQASFRSCYVMSSALAPCSLFGHTQVLNMVFCKPAWNKLTS